MENMRDRIAVADAIAQRAAASPLCPAVFLRYLLGALLLSLILFGCAAGVRADDLHAEGYAGTIASRARDEVRLNPAPGAELGRGEELWVYQKRDTIQVGGVVVKVNWARAGKVRVSAREADVVTAAIVEEYPGLSIGPRDEIGRLENTPPRITSVVLGSSAVKPNHEVSLCVEAQDDEGDALSYSAQANAGKLLGLSERSPVFQWVAPDTPGAYMLVVRVTDARGGTIRNSVTIQVQPLAETDPYALVSALGGTSRSPWRFGEVTDIDIDERGNLWVLDRKNLLLRIIDPTGTQIGAIDLTGGGSAYGLSPSNVSLGSDGVLYVLDSAHKTLDQMAGNGDAVTRIFDNSEPKASVLGAASDVAPGRNGDIMIPDAGGGHVAVFDRAGRFVLLFAEQGSGPGRLMSPVSAAVNKYGDIFVLDAGADKIVEFDSMFRYRTSRVCLLEDGAGSILVDDRDGSVFVLDSNAGAVKKLDSSGEIVANITLGGEDSRAATATGMALRPDGNVLVSTSDARIREFDPAGTLRGALGEDAFGKVSSIALTDDGDLFVVDSQAAQVKRFDRHGWLHGRFGAKGKYAGQFLSPAAIGVDADGNSYVFDDKINCIQRFYSTNAFHKVLPVADTVAGNLKDAADMAVTEDGRIYVLDQKRSAVFVLSREGELLRIVPLATPEARASKQLKRPAHIAVDKSGNLYVSDPSEYAVYKFNAEGMRINKLGAKGSEPGQFGSIADIAVDGSGSLYVLLRDRRTVAKFAEDGRFQVEIPLVVDENISLRNPETISVNSFGTLAVYDGAHKAVFTFMQ
jgi:DNA-binding beta-propeller fold protein YncE